MYPLSRILAALGLSLLLVGCSALQLPPRLQPSGLNSHFTAGHADFAAYIAERRAMMAAARLDLHGVDADTRARILDGNAPRRLAPAVDCPAGATRPYRQGVVLTHGLTDSPYSMHQLAAFYRQQCLLVYVLQLPGHGSRPGDLTEVRWQDWRAALAFAVAALREEAEVVHLAGFSTGAALSVELAGRDPGVSSLMLFSPAMAVDPRAGLTCWLARLPGRGAWLEIAEDGDRYKYESFAANAACQVHRLTGEIAPALDRQPLRQPLFVVQSADDATVDAAASLALYRQARHPDKRLILYHRPGPGVAVADLRDDPRVDLIDSYQPTRRVLSSAHTGITLDEDDPHYGRLGSYASCGHYAADPARMRACQRGEPAPVWGEKDLPEADQQNLRRLTFNPWFDHMAGRLREFLERR